MRAEIFDKLFTDLFKTRLELIQKKRNDYAGELNVFSNFEETARQMEMTVEQIFLFWITIKRQRLANLLLNCKTPKNESLEDTLNDLANYTDLFAIWKKGQQGV
jgi:hypothetical protein